MGTMHAHWSSLYIGPMYITVGAKQPDLYPFSIHYGVIAVSIVELSYMHATRGWALSC